MGKSSRAKQEIKDDKTSKGRQISGKGSTSSISVTPESYGLRRSVRETSSKEKITPSPSSTLKTERLGKQSPATTTVRKSERIEKQNNPAPLRRVTRSKMLSSYDVSGSRNSNKSSDTNMKRTTEKKKKNENTIKELVLETEYIDKNVKLDEEAATFNKVRMDARHYRKFFKKTEKSVNMTDHVPLPEETNEDAANIVLGNIQNPTSTNSALNGAIRDCEINEEVGRMLSKRKRDTADMVPHAPLMVGSKETCINNADANSLISSRCKSKDCDESCNACFKKQRMESETPAKENFCCNTKPNSLFDSAAMDIRELNAGDTSRLAEKPNNDLPQNGPSEKSESSRYIEYWVPVQISNVQLEQYCAILLDNSLPLSSLSRSDPVDALRKTLTSLRKCCDHPYLVDPSLPKLLTKDPSEFLDVGVKASGKLQLLEAMLLETRRRGLRVIVLFQSIGGSGRDIIGDILDDFLRQRFGLDSFERIDAGLVHSKKQSALKKFNTESGRFAFLLEMRACFPSIKLSAVDIVIMFNSDWNPMSDIKALQKISLDSKCEHIMIFRLYSSLTVEEKVLIFAKQEMVLDSNIQNIIPSTSQTLLMWGASYLFNKLDEFHDGDAPALRTTILDDVLQDFSAVLTRDRGDCDSSKLSLIVRAKPQVTYKTDFPLFGEQKVQVVNEDPPCTFWTKLLNGKHPRWKYSSKLIQRSRKRESAHHFDYSEKSSKSEGGKSVKKHKNIDSAFLESSSLKTGSEKQMAVQVNGGTSVTPEPKLSHSLNSPTALLTDKIHSDHASTSSHSAISPIPKVPQVVEGDKRKELHDSEQSLHSLLKPEIAKLSEVLHLPDNVRGMAESFLEYILNNHHVDKEPATRLQAFQLSLCWTSAALLKHKINHKESLAVAKQYLNFGCTKQEAEYVYSLLQCLKKMFLYRTGQWKPPKTFGPSTKHDGTEHPSAASNPQEVKGVEDLLKVSESSEKQVLSRSDLTPDYQLAKIDLEKSIKEIQKKCEKKLKREIQKQFDEKQGIKRTYEEEKEQLEKKKKTEEAVVRLLRNQPTRSGSLKKLNDDYEMNIAELNKKMELHLKNLESLHTEARNTIHQSKEKWVEHVRSWARKEFGLDECNQAITSGHDQEHTANIVSPSKEEIPSGGVPDGGIGQEVPASDGLDGASSMRCLPEGQIRDTDMLSSSGEQVPDEGTFINADTEFPVGASQAISETEGDNNSVSVTSHLSKDQNPDEATLAVACGEAPTYAAEVVGFSDDRQNVLPIDLSSFREQNPYVSSSSIAEEVSSTEPETLAGDIVKGDGLSTRKPLNMLDGEVPVRTPEAVSSRDALDNAVSTNPSPTEEQIPGKVPFSGSHLASKGVPDNVPITESLSLPDGEVEASTLVVSSREALDNVVSTIPSSTEEQGLGVIPLSGSQLTPEEVQNRNQSLGDNDGVADKIPIAKSLSFSEGEVEASTSEVVITCCDHGFQTVFSVNPPREEENPDVVPSCMSDREVPFLEPESAPSEVLQGGTANQENDGAMLASACEVVNPPMEEENPEVAPSCVLSREVPFNEPESAPSKVLEGGTANQENDGAMLASTCEADNPPMEEENPEVATTSSLSDRGFLLGSDSAPSEVLGSEGAIREDGRLIQESSSVITNETLAGQVEPGRTTLQPSDVPSTSRVELFQPLNNEGQPSQAPQHATDPRTVSRNHPVQTVSTVSCSDPLKKEMERLKREKDETIKSHEETKLKLKFDFDKEMEEAMAQIRKKYEVKVKETDTVFQLKVKEVEANLNKVIMSKFLADAFRRKMMDDNPTGTPPGMGSNAAQQLVVSSSEQMAPRPSLVAGSAASANLPAPITPTSRVLTASRPVITPQVRPSLQAAYVPPAIFSPTPPRPLGTPPLISSVILPRNPQISTEIRATPPHLRQYRPPSSTPPIINIQQGLNNPVPARTTPVSSQPSRAAYTSPASVGLPVFPNPNTRDFVTSSPNQSTINPNLPNSLPSNIAPPFQPQFRMPSTRPNPPQPSTAPDVVDLSDDDEDHLQYLNL